MDIYDFPHLYEITFRTVPPFSIWRAEWAREVHKFLISLPKKPSSIVDLCCGTGFLFPMIKSIYPDAEMVGIDISDSMIKFANKHHTFVEFRCSDITSVKNNFEVVIMGGGLTTIPVSTAIDAIDRISPSHFILSGYRMSLWSLTHRLFVRSVMGIKCHISSSSDIIHIFESRGIDVSISPIDWFEGSYAIWSGVRPEKRI